MNWKRLLICAFAAALFSIPAQAGTVGLYGAYWDTDEADSSWGAGARAGFDFVDWLELEFHGTYYPDLGADLVGLPEALSISAIPVDAGLKFKFFGEKPGLYAGAGFTYYFLDIEDGEIDPSFVVSHHMNLEEAARGYDMFMHKQDEVMKIVLQS